MLKFFKKKADPRKELRRTLSGFQLRSFPAVAMKGLQVLRSDTSTLNDAARVLEADPGISARLLGIVNSASTGLRHPVKNLGQAVTLLGKGQVETLLTAIAVRDAIHSPDSEHFDNSRFWRAASRRASIARAFARILHPATHSVSYTAALLQEMAVPVLASSHGDSYGQLLSQWRSDGSCLASLERDALNFDHAEVAGWLCQEWKLPDNLIGAIVTHHDPEDDENSAPVAVGLSALLGEVDGNKSAPLDEMIQVAHGRHGLATDRSVALIEEAFVEADEIAKLFAA